MAEAPLPADPKRVQESVAPRSNQHSESTASESSKPHGVATIPADNMAPAAASDLELALGEDKASRLLEVPEQKPVHDEAEADAHHCGEGSSIDSPQLAELLNRKPYAENPNDVAAVYDEIPAAGPHLKSGPVGNTSVSQPAGALSNIIVYATAGHGYVWENSAWRTQRGAALGMVEDMGNLEQYNFFVNYAFNAGATVVPIRPVGYQRNEVVLDNDSTSVTWSGTWANSSATVFYGSAGDVPYRWTNTAATQSAYVRYTPTIGTAGYYPVYTWALSGSDRVKQLYRIKHSGGTAEVRVNHKRVGMGWVWLGTYHFEAGTAGYAEISNLSSETGVVIADTIRFGNGMGNINRGGGVSGFERELEAARYWVQNAQGQGVANVYDNSTGDDHDDDIGVRPRYAALMNDSTQGGFYDRIYISMHSNAATGTLRGAMGLAANSDKMANQDNYAKTINSELETAMEALDEGVDFPYNWSDTSIDFLDEINYGELKKANINNEMCSTIIEVAYHDNAEDAKLMEDPRVRDAMGRSICRGIVKFLNQYGGGTVPAAYLPLPPTDVAARTSAAGTVTVSWVPPAANTAIAGAPTSYVITRSTNGYGFGNPVTVTGGTANSATISGLTAGQTYFFRVSARNAGGESMASPAVGVNVAPSGSARILVVNGYDRFDRSIAPNRTFGGTVNATISMIRPQEMNAFDYVVQHGKAIAAAGYSFDSCANEVVEFGGIDLSAYDLVVWNGGQQAEVTTDGPQPEYRSMNAAVQAKLQTFANGGGSLFVSGSEIAWDLDRDATQNDASSLFLNNVLRADYVDDNPYTGVANANTATGVAGSIFDGVSLTFDNGGDGTYKVEFPDVINAAGGSSVALRYTGSTEATVNAAVQYAGTSRVVCMGFPFETIFPESSRNTVMSRALNFLLPSAPTATPTPSPIPTATPTPTASPLPSATPTATVTPTATPVTTPAVTDVIVDNANFPAYQESGTWASSVSAGYYGGGSRYAVVAGQTNAASWTPTIATTARYNVYVWYVAGTNRSTCAAYKVTHRDGVAEFKGKTANDGIPDGINQTTGGSQWVLLGTYNFAAGSTGSVLLDGANSFNDGSTSTVISADAVKFTYAGPATP